MSDHVCGVFDQPKRVGCCLCCSEPVYTVKSVHPEGHPLAGHPNSLGPMLPHGLQVEFLLSNGAEADVTFCEPCARNLKPEHYILAWGRVIDRTDLALQLEQRRDTERRIVLTEYMTLWPIAVLRWRRENAELKRLVVDKRRHQPAEAAGA